VGASDLEDGNIPIDNNRAENAIKSDAGTGCSVTLPTEQNLVPYGILFFRLLRQTDWMPKNI